MIIREASEEDAEQLAKLSTELGYVTKTEDLLRRFKTLKNKIGHHIYVADDGIVKGFISFEHYELIYFEPGINITGFVVSKTFRNNGIGKKLMEEVEKYAIENNFTFIRANSSSKRIDAHEVYRKLGFNSEKDQKRFLKNLSTSFEI